ncbi:MULTISPECIES: tripartite tricarboxylate transporter substrate binding protein [unclassified Variovorax]|uniref:Bug family tripartite tricarboxylate transporter substrate binding protein n=1 Tax=unclassified Variovorax TaxID=663243 RepID=UPI0025753DEF|nr:MULTISPECIES: tripartite tricarboxylate transporter substrate binding protein [unclassified Variovorax]MDM0089254.1 tripartite tricarboxylate transporter substrate binding protein [Variovorax sp. J22G40]MDM0147327.1 tripartite tricarboxylate transporter substrate binding protein [Variovorax sp. J2P1-31]
MKHIVKSLVLVTAIAAGAMAQAQFPEKPIRIVVPYPPGGATDALSRMVGQKLTRSLGQPTLVDNRPGASEQVAMNFVTKAPADGYTIMLSTTGGLAVNPSLYGSKLSYRPQEDLTPIVQAASLPSVVFVHPSLPVKTLGELTEHIRRNPGTVSYASTGPGQPSHLAMELYKRMTGVSAVHVPYKGGAPALQDLVGGQVQVMVAIAGEGMPFAAAGKLRPLAVASTTPSPLYPQLPSAADAPGLKGFEMPTWFAFMAPAGTPKAVVDKLNQAINEALQEPDIRTRLSDMGVEPEGGTPEALAARIKADTLKWSKVIAEAGIKLE